MRAPQRKSATSTRRKSSAPAAKSRAAAPAGGRGGRRKAESADWATDLEFDVREPKLAVSLRLDADVLRFFRAFGSGYQTRINEVLKAFMHARQRAGLSPEEAASRTTMPRKAGRGRKR